MVELSQNKARVGTQDRPVFRRASVLPRRSGPDDSPQRRNNIDVRAGRRGDGGAQAVMQLARQINGTFEDVQRYSQQKFIYDEQQNAFKAVADEQLGTPDEGLMEESDAYRAAFSLSKIETEMAEARPMLLENLNKYVSSYEGVNLAEAMADIDQMTEVDLQMLLSDEDGNLRDLGTAQAFAVASTRVGKLQQDLRTQGVTAMRGKIADNGRKMELNRGLAEVRNNGVLDIPRMIASGQTYGLSDDQMVDTVVDLISVIDREDPAKAAALSRQLLGIADDVRSVRAPARGTVAERWAPTGKLPVAGRITSYIGDGRNHNGVDIDGKIGDPIEAPAGGRVIEVGKNARAGNFIRIEHANGVESTYSHLDASLVSKGDLIRPGQRFATVGNTGNVKRGPNGDGSNLHWVVRENGKMVNPLEFQFPEFEAESTVIEVAQAVSEETPGPTMILPAGFQLNPAQLDKLSGIREMAEERSRILKDRAEKERHEATSQSLYEDIMDGHWPSDQQLRELADQGLLSRDGAYNFRSMRQTKERSDRVEADRIIDRAERDRNQAADEWVANRAMEWNVGEGPTTHAEFERFIRENDARLGEGTNRLQNYTVLRTAFTRMQSMTTGDPMFRAYNTHLGDMFKSKSSGGVASAFGEGVTNRAKIIAQTEYRRLVVEDGMAPDQAFIEVSRKYGKEADAKSVVAGSAADDRLSALEVRRRAAGIE